MFPLLFRRIDRPPERFAYAALFRDSDGNRVNFLTPSRPEPARARTPEA